MQAVSCDIHTHNPRPDVPSIVDMSGCGDFVVGIDNFSVGIHPKSITEGWRDVLAEIEILAQKPGFAGVGECGLDKFAPSPRDLQENVFEAQLILAQRLNKPVIIHCVRLYTDVLRIIKKVKFQNPAVFHGYNGNPDITAQLLKLPNTYFSFSATTLATTKTAAYKSLPLIPASRILTESDCDSSADIAAVANTIAIIKQTDITELQQTIYDNFMRITERP